ncbi:MAG: dihydrolipoyl dehydrogenase [Lachnospiraceae bacterium]|nr:dihydrolipoyl dehydrogenase [Lachnospiraceae bacterium]
MKYDLIVIGGGPGGYPAALYAAKNGLKTILFEEKELGGTCLNRGCIPTKALLHGTELIRQVRSSSLFTSEPQTDTSELFSKKDSVVETLRGGIETSLSGAKVEVIKGRARITGPGTVVCGKEQYEAENILVAAGAKPSVLRMEGAELPGVVTSDMLFADMPEKIGRLVIIGGGVIGCEIASIYSELGTEVTILEYQPYLLPLLDREIGRNLQLILKKRNVNVQCGAEVLRICSEDGLKCTYRLKGKEADVPADMVLLCTGRMADTGDLFAETAGVEINRGIVTDENFETSVKGIYAVGDVISGTAGLAHAATAQGIRAVAHMLGKEAPSDTAVIPSCVYTSPEIGCVGLTQEEAAAGGIQARTKKVTTYSNARSMIADAERGFVKIVYREDGLLLGAQMMCERASDMIAVFADAIVQGLSVQQMARVIYPHPSFSETIGEVLEAAAQDLLQE